MGGKWLVTGASGQLGRELQYVADEEGVGLRGLTRDQLDITDRQMVHDVLADERPDVVVNTAAWTDVDGAESYEVDAYVVNADGPRHLAEVCKATGAHLIHISTDYVFSGDRRDGLPWGEADVVRPLSAYGRTKAAGERAVLGLLPSHGSVVRTAWLYSRHGHNFALTMLARARAGEAAAVVRDQWGQPTWARDLARRILMLGEGQRQGRLPVGVFHGTNSGQASWWEFARWIYSLAGADPGLVSPLGSADIVRPAPRPTWSVLGHDRWAEIGMRPMRPWTEALVASMAELIDA